MEKSSVVILSKSVFGQNLANKFSSLSKSEYSNLIFKTDTLWSVCTNPEISAVEAYATIDPDKQHFAITRACVSPYIDDMIKKEINANSHKNYSIMLFNSEGINISFGLSMSTKDRVSLVTKVLSDMYQYRYCLLWAPFGQYFTSRPADIPYFLLSAVSLKVQKTFFEKYSTFDETSLNFIISNLPESVLGDLVKISSIPTVYNIGILLDLCKEAEKCESS